jgi:RNA polymerase sigma-19 factor, ECF subfamily
MSNQVSSGSIIKADGPSPDRPLPDAVAARHPQLRPKVVRLFQEYAPAVCAFFLRRLGNREDAREATQEVFLQLWRQERKGQLQDEARAYLFTAADNLAKDCRRRARTRVSDMHEPLAQHEFVAPNPEFADVVHWGDGLRIVVECMQELSAETQRIFLLYHGSRMTYTEIAKQLGITTRTVERHMAQAIAHCKVRLKAYL